MINFRIYNILSTFSKKDWNNFHKYVKSTDVISEREYLPLFLELKRYSKKLDALENIPEQEIFNKAYGKDLNKRTISTRQSEFLNLLKKYLESLGSKKKELFKINFYYDELLSRNLTDMFTYEYRREKSVLEKYSYDKESYKIISEIIGKSLTSAVRKNERHNDKTIDAIFKYSDIILADIIASLFETGMELQILRYYDVKKNNSLLNLIDALDFEKLIEDLENRNEAIFVAPLIHYYIYKGFKDEKYIAKAKKIFFENEKHFQQEFKLEIYGMILSCYNKRIFQGETKYFKDAFLLNKRKLSQNIISDITNHSAFDYSIISEYVNEGIAVKEFNWTEMVIEKYSPLLPEDIRNDEYTISMAKLYFAKGEYARAIDLISNYKVKNLRYSFALMEYKLKSYFELQNFEECYKEIDNARHYCKNNRAKFSSDRGRISAFLKFLDGFSKLLNYCANPFKKDINDVAFYLQKLGYKKDNWLNIKTVELSEEKF